MATLAAPGVSATARSRSDVTDHDLVEAVRAGDDRAFERLYERYHRRIASYIFGMVRDHGRAEDLTQEVFVSALRRMRQTDREIHFKPWIYEIAKNACIDAFRRSRRAEEVSFDAEVDAGGADAARLATTAASTDAAVAQRQRLDHLWGAFDGLSDAHHQILVMRELEGLSYAEIGERLGMTRASVESTLFRARRRLTEEFEELQNGEACRRAQGIIDTAGSTALGRRDQRRLGRHIARCTACRRDAVMAGMDAAVLARLPVRAKVGALLPLPAFLRRRLTAGDGGGASHAAAQWSAAAASYGDAPANLVKVVAALAAVAVAGVGAGTVVTSGAHERHAASAAPAAAASGSRQAPASGGASTAGHRRGAAATGNRASARSTGSVARSTGGASRDGRDDRASHGGSSAGGTTGGSATGGSITSGGGTTSTRTSAGTSTGATAQPLVQPNPSALLQQPSSTPTTVGGAVQQTTATVGDTVGGSVGSAVKDTGAAVGTAVDQVTTTAADTVKTTVNTVDSTVQGVTSGLAQTVDSATQTTSTTVQDTTDTVSGVVGSIGGQ